jgi:hypothetical protein
MIHMPHATSPEVQVWIDGLPENPGKQHLLAMRQVILDSLPTGFEEGISYGMIGYCVPHSIYPAGYHCNSSLPLPFASLALQKKHVALYHMGLYADDALMQWFVAQHKEESSQKLDIGKSCIRYAYQAEIPLNLIGQLMSKMTPSEWITLYERLYRNK